MIKNIQKYLLLHHPIMWNIRLIPMLLLLAGVHLMFFGIGFVSANPVFGNEYYSYRSPYDDLGLMYFVCALVGVLILIGWLLFYSKNNGFKNYYPRSSKQLYLEWVLIFIITSGIALLPLTLTQGNVTRWKAVATKSECIEAQDILTQARILIPDDKSDYTYNSEYQKPIPIPKGAAFKIDTLDFDLHSFEYNQKGNIIIKGYTGPSLLFFSDYPKSIYGYYLDFADADERTKKEIQLVEQVKQWLKQGDKEKIYGLMQDFMKLQEKHGLKSDLTVDTWFNRVYNAPYFPVNNTTTIGRRGDSDYYSSYPTDFHLCFNELDRGYEQIMRNYNNTWEIPRYMSLVCLFISICASIFIFSFRVTNGKSWLINLVSSGVLIFISGLIGVASAEVSSYRSERAFISFFATFWLIIFVISIVNIITKVTNPRQGYKGLSNIMMNMALWLLPMLCPLIYFGAVTFVNENPESESIEITFWISIVITIVTMWFASILVRKWKSLPED